MLQGFKIRSCLSQTRAILLHFLSIALVLSTLGHLQAAGVSFFTPRVAPIAVRLEVANPGVAELEPENFSRIMAVSDVHGMHANLLKLLQAAKLIEVKRSSVEWIGGKTLLLVIGDSIDKGPQSVDVIDLWMSLSPRAEKSGGRIVHLLGNHEAELLSDPDEAGSAFRRELKERNISVEEFYSPKFSRGLFLLSMPVAAKVGSWLFSHSGFYPSMSWSSFKAKTLALLFQPTGPAYYDAFFIGESSILEAKKWDRREKDRLRVIKNLSENGFVGSVFGHQPNALRIRGSTAISLDRRLIKIDNGMAPQAGAHPGSVLLFSEPTQLKTLDAASLPKLKVNRILPSGEIRTLPVEQG